MISSHMQVKLVYMMCLWNSRYCLTGKNILFMSQLGYIVFILTQKKEGTSISCSWAETLGALSSTRLFLS